MQRQNCETFHAGLCSQRARLHLHQPPTSNQDQQHQNRYFACAIVPQTHEQAPILPHKVSSSLPRAQQTNGKQFLIRVQHKRSSLIRVLQPPSHPAAGHLGTTPMLSTLALNHMVKTWALAMDCNDITSAREIGSLGCHLFGSRWGYAVQKYTRSRWMRLKRSFFRLVFGWWLGTGLFAKA